MNLLIPQNHVQEAFDRGRRRFPSIALSFEEYLRRVDEILRNVEAKSPASAGSSKNRIAAFSRWHHEDLFLATGCAAGDRVAWEIFADHYASCLRRYAVQACRHADEGEDLSQEIMADLLGGGSGRRSGPGRLAKYDGRGSLAGWLRVVVARAAIDRYRRGSRQVSLDGLKDGESLMIAPRGDSLHGDDAEDLDSRWGTVLSEVLTRTIEKLSSRQRLLLGFYYVQGLSLKTIGRHFRVHEATASRWLEGVRRSIRKAVERDLQKEHGLKAREIKSLWRWVSEDGSFSLIGLVPVVERTQSPDKKVQGDLI